MANGHGGKREGSGGNGKNRETMLVSSLARDHTLEALATLVSLMRHGETGEVKKSAAIAILDRGWGKPHIAVTAPEGVKGVMLGWMMDATE